MLDKFSADSDLARYGGCNWGCLGSKGSVGDEGGTSGWQWINKLKLRGSLQVSMETPREVAWAVFSGAFCKATERRSGRHPRSRDGTEGAALAEPLPAPHLPRMRPEPLLLSLRLVTESVSARCQGFAGHLGWEPLCAP